MPDDRQLGYRDPWQLSDYTRPLRSCRQEPEYLEMYFHRQCSFPAHRRQNYTWIQIGGVEIKIVAES